METRTLGRTGLQVNPFYLGAMMSGEFGNSDHSESVDIIHTALDAGINFIDTADVYSYGASEEIAGKALAGGKREQVVLTTKFHMPIRAYPNMSGNSHRWSRRAVEDSPPAATDRLDRPLSGAPTVSRLRYRRNAGGVIGPGAGRQGAHVRHFHLTGRADRRSPMGGQSSPMRALHHRAAALFHPRPPYRVGCPTGVRTVRTRRTYVEPLAGGQLAGKFRRAAPAAVCWPRRRWPASRY